MSKISILTQIQMIKVQQNLFKTKHSLEVKHECNTLMYFLFVAWYHVMRLTKVKLKQETWADRSLLFQTKLTHLLEAWLVLAQLRLASLELFLGSKKPVQPQVAMLLTMTILSLSYPTFIIPLNKKGQMVSLRLHLQEERKLLPNFLPDNCHREPDSAPGVALHETVAFGKEN